MKSRVVHKTWLAALAAAGFALMNEALRDRVEGRRRADVRG